MDPATIMGNIRLHGFTPSEVSTLEAIFQAISSTSSGAFLFTTDRLNNAGLDVFKTLEDSHGGGRDGLFGFFANADIFLNFDDAVNTNYINQFGEVTPIGLTRLVLHELIHASTGMADISLDDYYSQFLSGDNDVNLVGETVTLANIILMELSHTDQRLTYVTSEFHISGAS